MHLHEISLKFALDKAIANGISAISERAKFDAYAQCWFDILQSFLESYSWIKIIGHEDFCFSRGQIWSAPLMLSKTYSMKHLNYLIDVNYPNIMDEDYFWHIDELLLNTETSDLRYFLSSLGDRYSMRRLVAKKDKLYFGIMLDENNVPLRDPTFWEKYSLLGNWRYEETTPSKLFETIKSYR